MRNRAWQKRNSSYHSVSGALRKRGLLAQYAAELNTLKGRGIVPAAEVRAMFGGVIVPKGPRAKKSEAREPKETKEWYAAHRGVPQALRWLAKHSMLTSERRDALRAITDAASWRDALARIGVDPSDAWQHPSPDAPTHLCTAVQLSVLTREGKPSRRIHDEYGLRLLHGVLHRSLEVGHRLHANAFALTIRRGTVWLVTTDADVLSRLRSLQRVLFSGDRDEYQVIVGARSKMRAPPPRDAGQWRARVVIERPLVLTRGSLLNGRESKRLRDAPEGLESQLERICIRLGLPVPPIVCRVLHADVERVLDSDGVDGVRVGGHIQLETPGRVAALVGVLDVECNAAGRWLLDCAALVGLGGKTAFGFGRVRVEDA